MNTKNESIILRTPNVPIKLKARAKVAAINKNQHFYEWVIEALREKLKREKK